MQLLSMLFAGLCASVLVVVAFGALSSNVSVAALRGQIGAAAGLYFPLIAEIVIFIFAVEGADPAATDREPGAGRDDEPDATRAAIARVVVGLYSAVPIGILLFLGPDVGTAAAGDFQRYVQILPAAVLGYYYGAQLAPAPRPVAAGVVEPEV